MTRCVFLIITGMILISGCDIIKEEDRLIPITDGSVKEKKVFLIEFTDQNCRNCPFATAEIDKLMERFSDTIVTVSIHASPLPLPLRTKEGNEYEQYFQAEEHPAGIVDGGIGGKYMSHDPQTWGGFIIERLKIEPAVNINIDIDYDDITNKTQIIAKIKGNKALQNVKLLLWIIESNIQHWQLMPDGTRNENYIHNHIFRSTVNSTWGESFSIESIEEKDFFYTFALNSGWKPENISIIGFVFDFNTNEIFNVQKFKLIN